MEKKNIYSDPSNPFTTPKGYFSGLEDSILSKTLGNQEKQNPFTFPESYFEQLEEKIISQTVTKKEVPKGKIRYLFTKKSSWIAAAACLIFAFLTGIYMLTSNTMNSPELATVNKKTSAQTVSSDEKGGDGTNEKEISSDPVVSDRLYTVHTAKTKQTQTSSPKAKQVSTVSRQEQKTSDIIYSLYFEDTEDNAEALDMEEEFWL